MQKKLFTELGLSPEVLKAVAKMGFEEASPIQSETIPRLMEGVDIVGLSQTGSGKTAAFAIPAIEKVDANLKAPQVLILCPTRELAMQVAEEVAKLAFFKRGVRELPIYGGQSYDRQLRGLREGAQIIIGTPGRVMDHLERKTLKLDQVAMIILDEADRMLDMGFQPSIAAILKSAPAERQTLLFSATYTDGVRALSRGYQRAPRDVTVETPEVARDIDERFFEIDEGGGIPAVLALLAQHLPESTLVFCNLKVDCQKLVDALLASGISAAALHGDMQQHDRDHVLLLFANKSCSVLVATDVAARGLDIKELSLVINFELSGDPDVHHHRVGRTGRADHRGKAFSLFTARRAERLRAIELHTNRPVRIEGLPPRVQGRVRLIAPMATVLIAAGRRDKLRPSDVLGALTAEGGVDGSVVGKIDVRTADTYVAIGRAHVQAALVQLGKGRIKGRLFKARLAPLGAARG